MVLQSSPNLIKGFALCGEPGNGKSSITQELATILGWQRRSFAGPLKDEVAYALGSAELLTFSTNPRAKVPTKIFRDEMDNPAVKDKYRTILQWWGTEYRRAQDSEYWIKAFEKSIQFGATGLRFVVDDCRFNNEYEKLRFYGVRFVLLQPGETTRPVQEHASEMDWKGWQYDLSLTYELGPKHQADRICQFFGLS